jgi:hypothetical protein
MPRLYMLKLRASQRLRPQSRLDAVAVPRSGYTSEYEGYSSGRYLVKRGKKITEKLLQLWHGVPQHGTRMVNTEREGTVQFPLPRVPTAAGVGCIIWEGQSRYMTVNCRSSRGLWRSLCFIDRRPRLRFCCHVALRSRIVLSRTLSAPRHTTLGLSEPKMLCRALVTRRHARPCCPGYQPWGDLRIFGSFGRL